MLVVDDDLMRAVVEGKTERVTKNVKYTVNIIGRIYKKNLVNNKCVELKKQAVHYEYIVVFVVNTDYDINFKFLEIINNWSLKQTLMI